MKIEDIKCDWLTRLAELRREQDEDRHYYDNDEYLYSMFWWEDTPEGDDFWFSVNHGEITNKEEALKFLLEAGIIIQNEVGTYSFINGRETDKLYNE